MMAAPFLSLRSRAGEMPASVAQPSLTSSATASPQLRESRAMCTSRRCLWQGSCASSFRSTSTSSSEESTVAGSRPPAMAALCSAREIPSDLRDSWLFPGAVAPRCTVTGDAPPGRAHTQHKHTRATHGAPEAEPRFLPCTYTAFCRYSTRRENCTRCMHACACACSTVLVLVRLYTRVRVPSTSFSLAGAVSHLARLP